MLSLPKSGSSRDELDSDLFQVGTMAVVHMELTEMANLKASMWANFPWCWMWKFRTRREMIGHWALDDDGILDLSDVYDKGDQPN